MPKRIAKSHKNNQPHKVQRLSKETGETSSTTSVLPLKITWGCLISSSGVIELFKQSHVLGNQESNDQVNLLFFFKKYY